jgi:hypothetical protein
MQLAAMLCGKACFSDGCEMALGLPTINGQSRASPVFLTSDGKASLSAQRASKLEDYNIGNCGVKAELS